MAISPLETIILKFSAYTGGKVLLSDIRLMARMPKNEFDQAILSLATGGGYFLSACTRPLPSIETHERAEMIPNGQYGFYDAILPRCQEPVPEPPPAKQSGKKRGRHPIPVHLRRERVSGRFRLPAWLITWLSKQDNPGMLIEAALIQQHWLAPPDVR
jgi:hypothetical protein